MALQYTFQRYEKKYLVRPDQMGPLQAALNPFFAVDSYGKSTICNIYYDTPRFDLIRASIEKTVYKEKLRLRSYGTPTQNSTVFLELKKKYRGVVYKRREVLPLCQATAYLDHGISPQKDSQILHEIDWFRQTWPVSPQVFLAYERTALFGLQDAELRITFDQDIRWRTDGLDLRQGGWGEAILPAGHYLMEIKIPGTIPLFLSHILSQLEIFPVSFSKYGTCYKEHLATALFQKGGTTCA